ncbi:rhodanese-like domain-containing protein [Sulfurimonas sp.]|uniref:rhodanese-like domain-containing protein n=1 Tax=Sulfurimonas sp. TaxID=2022749 RepID=UPI0025D5FB05|nr:rhodanese-like domain-containing protein [Sulfurimonas sp.]
MNENIIYVFVALAIFIAYRKYTRYKVLQLVPALLEQDGKIVDVRTKDEFLTAHKDGSINIPLESLDKQMNKLDKTKPIIICCASGSRSGLARRSLMAKGFDNVYNAGAWRSLIKFQ